ncbi:hypothetical protein BDF21DRAFT_416662 [Thamnidium elegans]|uniref:Uncharacterized protein n=1 Tax=Thamnidium elegans TaxID=101142 RepID=A0A8H7SPL1_9FUNG|nr:hypothetical protein INT48_008870 [Thamnidium elegans]KAI8083805.1 hypothetical protein BDF21DRAFT_416662 [Thamnidium elegans]
MSSSIELSSLIIGIIVISVVAGIGLLGLVYLLVRRNNRKHEDVELSSSISATKKKRVFSLSSTTNNGEKKDIPVTSSLDTHDVFFTILEYPPTKPPTCIPNNRLLEVPTSHNNTTCSSFSVYEDRKLLISSNDPISVSLARQSIEERSGYYKSPTRTPVPYYHQSSLTSANSNLIIIDDNDEDEKAMQRWSTSSYHVW